MCGQERRQRLPLGVLDLDSRQPVIVGLQIGHSRWTDCRGSSLTRRPGGLCSPFRRGRWCRALHTTTLPVNVPAAKGPKQRVSAVGTTIGRACDPGRDRRAGQRQGGAGCCYRRRGLEGTIVRAGGDSRYPRPAMIGSVGRRTAVASGSGHKHTRSIGIQKRQFHGIAERVARHR